MYTNISDSAYELVTLGHFTSTNEVRILTTSSGRTVSNAGFETVWTEAGTYKFPTAAHPLSIVSSSTNDSANGANARTVRVDGLDADGNWIQEIVSLNGTTPVLTTQSFKRVNLTLVLTGGPLTVNGTITNAGKITVTQTISNLVLDTIIAGFNVSRKCVWSVPKGYKASIMSEKQAIGNNDVASFFTAVRSPNGVIYSYDEKYICQGLHSVAYPLSEPIPELFDIAVYCKSISLTAVVSAQFQLLLSKTPL